MEIINSQPLHPNQVSGRAQVWLGGREREGGRAGSANTGLLLAYNIMAGIHTCLLYCFLALLVFEINYLRRVHVIGLRCVGVAGNPFVLSMMEHESTQNAVQKITFWMSDRNYLHINHQSCISQLFSIANVHYFSSLNPPWK